MLDKQPIKFVRAVKQDLRSGKTEDRILVRPELLLPWWWWWWWKSLPSNSVAERR